MVQIFVFFCGMLNEHENENRENFYKNVTLKGMVNCCILLTRK